jgi:hypothetical protein
MKTAKPIGISETPKFPCPKWNSKKPGTLSFPGTPQEQHKECAREWSGHIKALLEGNTRGLTNARRKELAQLDRQLKAFLGSDE